MSILETHRERLLSAARMMFVFGVVVGLLFPVYLALDRLYVLVLFTNALASFLFQVTFSLVAGILCVSCYWSVGSERFGSASLRGVVAAALLVVVGMWFASVAVLAAALISSVYRTTSG